MAVLSGKLDRWQILTECFLCWILVFVQQPGLVRSRVFVSAAKSSTVCYSEEEVSLVCWYPEATRDKYFVTFPAWRRDDSLLAPLDASNNLRVEQINGTSHMLTVLASQTAPGTDSWNVYECELVLKVEGTATGTERSNALNITRKGVLPSPVSARPPVVDDDRASLRLRQDILCFLSYRLRLRASWRSATNSSDSGVVYSDFFNSTAVNSPHLVDIVLSGLSQETLYRIEVLAESQSEVRINSLPFSFIITTQAPSTSNPGNQQTGLTTLQIVLLAVGPVGFVALVAALVLCCVCFGFCVRRCFICKTRYTVKRRQSRDVYHITNKTSEEMQKKKKNGEEVLSPHAPQYAEVFWKGDTPVHRSTPRAVPYRLQASTAVVEYTASAFSLNTDPGFVPMTESLFKRKVTEAFDKAGIMLYSVQGTCFKQNCTTRGNCTCMDIQTFHPDIHGCFRDVTFVANCKLNSDLEPLEDADVWDVTLAKGGLGTPKGFVITASEQINNRLFQVIEASGVHFVSCTGGCIVDGWAEQIAREFKQFF